jgi:hypothetical protein
MTRHTQAFVLAACAAISSLEAQQRILVDSADTAQVERIGAWTSSSHSPQRFGPGYWHDGNSGKGSKQISFIPSITEAGDYEVYLWWPASPSYASNVPVDVIHAGVTDRVQVNQRENGAQWVLLGTYAFVPGSLGRLVIRTEGTNGHVIADAALWQKRGIIVDNDNSLNEAGSRAERGGAWKLSTWAPGFHGANYEHDENAGKGAKSFRWTANLTQSGIHTVYLKWTADSNRASNVPVDILYAGGKEEVEVNQRSNNGEWIALGSYWFNQGAQGRIEIGTLGTDGHVIADAAMWVLWPDSQADSDGDGLPNGYEDQVGLDPAFNDSILDPDGDGLTNLQEFAVGTSPLAPRRFSFLHATGPALGVATPFSPSKHELPG